MSSSTSQRPTTLDGSPYAADLARRLESVGIDKAAMEWLVKCLHPPSVSTAPGLPDETYVNMVRPEFRDQTIVSAPASVATATWDLLVWRLPGDRAPLQWFAGDAGTDFANYLASTIRGQGILTLQPLAQAPDFQYIGILPAALNWTQAILASSSLPFSYRTVYASMTAYLTASSLNDQGTVFAGQFPAPCSVSGPDTDINAKGPGGIGNFALFNRYVTSVPFRENEMLLLDPKAYTAPARDGCYQPLRLTGPTQPFAFGETSLGKAYRNPPTSAAGTVVLVASASNANVLMPTLPAQLTNMCGGGFNSTRGYSGVSYTGPLYSEQFNTAFDNVNHGVVLFRGLSLQASVTLKLYTGLEMVPRFDAPGRQFMQPPAKSSPMALDAYYAICHELGTSFPASYNSLGTLLSTIGGVVAKIWPVAKRVVPLLGLGERMVRHTLSLGGNPPGPHPDLSARQQVVVRRGSSVGSRGSVRSVRLMAPKSKKKLARGKTRRR
jgi:hypothetical protein